MKKTLIALSLAALTLTGCSDSNEPDLDIAGLMDCMFISGGYNLPVTNKYTGKKDTLKMIVESDCDVAYSSSTMGSGMGTLSSNGDGSYSGTVTSTVCPSGKAWVNISSGGYLNSDCL